MKMRGMVNVAGMVLLASCALCAQNDAIYLVKDNAKQTGKISEYDFNGVKASMQGGASTTWKTAEVKSVEFDQLPRELKAADTNYATGRDEEAATGYQELIAAKKIRRVLRQEAYYKLGNALLKTGKPDEAVAAFKAMIAEGEFPNSRYLPQIHDLVYSALSAGGKFDEIIAFASSEASRLGRNAEAAALVEHLNLHKVRAMVSKGDAGAKALITQLAGGTGAGAAEAKVLLGDLKYAEKDGAGAEKLYREALAANPSRMVKAAARNGIGEIQLVNGTANKKTDVLDEALLSYLWGAVLYTPSEGEPTTTHETALYKSGVCFQTLGDLEAKENKEAQKQKFLRARDMYRRVCNLYPQSPLAADAKARIERMGG